MKQTEASQISDAYISNCLRIHIELKDATTLSTHVQQIQRATGKQLYCNYTRHSVKVSSHAQQLLQRHNR